MLDLPSVLEAHRQVTGRFADVLAESRGDTPVPHLDWTVAELGAHVLSGARGYTRAVREGVPGWADARDGVSGNRVLIEQTPEQEPAEIAAAIPEAVSELHEVIQRHRGRIAAWGQIQLDPVVLMAMHTGDVSVHGWDLARALRSRWRIDQAHAAMAVEAMFDVIPHFVDEVTAAGFSATYGITVRHAGTWTASFDNGTLRVDRGSPQKADCRLNNDPVAFLLIAFKRVPLWRPALTGRALAYGRRPWLRFKFPNLVAST